MPFKSKAQMQAMMLSENPKTRQVAKKWLKKYGSPTKMQKSPFKMKKQPVLEEIAEEEEQEQVEDLKDDIAEAIEESKANRC